ncbi:MAG: HAD family hydrolase [Solirubrobacterales bacterium]
MSVVVCDIDGTLVDTNYHHALAWHRAFRRSGVVVPVWRIHRAIGMGGDQLVAALAGDEVESEKGDAIRDAEKALYTAMIEEVEPFEGAGELLDELGARGHELILASSAKADEVDHYLDLLDARERVAGWTTSADVDETKPEPDLVEAALAMAGSREAVDDAVMLGDSVWDVAAAAHAGIPTIAVLSGGFAEHELRGAGAVEAFESVDGLRRDPAAIDRAREAAGSN